MAAKRASDLRAIYQSAINAVKGRTVMNNSIKLSDDKLFVMDRYCGNRTLEYSLKDKDIYIIGAGKAVYGLCEGFLSLLERYNEQVAEEKARIQIRSGILSVPYGMESHKSNHRHQDQTDNINPLFAKYNVTVHEGAKNNFLDSQSVETTKAIISLIEKKIHGNCNVTNHNPDSPKECLVLSFMSGGGSALLALPKPGLTIEEKCHLIKSMAKRGCNIVELNQVRTCLSQVKGGKLAEMILSGPGGKRVQVLSLIASDIIGDPIDLVASGPTVVKSNVNPSVAALGVISKFNIALPQKIKTLIESEKECPEFGADKLQNVILVNSRVAVEAANGTARKLGYKTIDMGTAIEGEASSIGKEWSALAKATPVDNVDADGLCWIGNGETTVTMPLSCSGLGGRCQEMALTFFVETMNVKEDNVSLLAAGTDGQDGATPVAGCVTSCGEERLKPEAIEALESHDSYRFWTKHIPSNFVTTGGPTGVNVMDIYCMIKSK